MPLYIKKDTSSLLKVGSFMAGAADCCCADICVDCVELPWVDCQCNSADFTTTSQSQIQLDVGGEIDINPGSPFCAVPATQAVSTTFTLSCESSASESRWQNTWVRHWQYCTYFSSGTTYVTYTMLATIQVDATGLAGGTYDINIFSKALLGGVLHTGPTPPANSCVGSWTPVASASCPFIGVDPASPPLRIEEAQSNPGTFDGNRYSSVDCPAECQQVVQRSACLSSWGALVNTQVESTSGAHTANLTFTLSVV